MLDFDLPLKKSDAGAVECIIERFQALYAENLNLRGPDHWRKCARTALSLYRDNMLPEDIAAVERFLGPEPKKDKT